ncbi:MAG: Wzz/FepE/Etk N-terminal domain-containing protein [Pseudomonadota bacterium]|nr:Wzz/FepE/Etk N-terminal domain-containing protein [Pseudomonadota bacterium]
MNKRLHDGDEREGGASSAVMQPLYVSPCLSRDEGLDLVAVWRGVLKRKFVVLGSVVITLLISLIYLGLAPETYRAEAGFLPPHARDIQALVVDEWGAKKYTSASVYEEFRKNLRSGRLARKFHDIGISDDAMSAGGAPVSKYGAAGDMTRNFTVVEDALDPRFTMVTYEARDAESAAGHLNRFADAANRMTVDDLHADVMASIQARVQRLQDEIAGKLERARIDREDRIAGLREAEQIARVLGLDGPGAMSVSPTVENDGTEIVAVEMPKFLQGSKAIQAEIAVLEARKDDSPFSEGLRDLQEKLANLEKVTIPKDELSAVVFDRPATVPRAPASPKKLLVIVSALCPEFDDGGGVCQNAWVFV